MKSSVCGEIWIVLLVSASALWPCLGSAEAPEAARIYDSLQSKRLLFTVRREAKSQGPLQTIVETFTGPRGTEAVRTEAILDQGHLKSYRFREDQTHESGKIDVGGGKVYFEYTDASGRTKKDQEDLRGDVVVGLTLRNFVRKHWQELLAGKDVDMRFGVPERQETVGFKIFLVPQAHLPAGHGVARGGTPVVVFEMKPSSFLIAALVKPLYFSYDRTQGELLEIDGRTLPKLREGDHWKDLDAVTVFGKS